MAGRIAKEKNPKVTTHKQCINCLEEKRRDKEFYGDYTFNSLNADHKLSICKNCLWNIAGDTGDIVLAKEALRTINRPYLSGIWESSINEAADEKSVFRTYMKNIQMKERRTLTWEDSDDFAQIVNNGSEDNTIPSPAILVDKNRLVIKWGEGYTTEEYRSFERKYDLLRNNYQEKTAMHTEALLTYIRYRVKEELSTAKGLVKDAKEWGSLAQKAAQDAKINPSQLSKSDLSDGLDTFGQLVRSVEQAVDIIPILPKFKSRPQDKVDFTIWCYINYVRDLKGLPLAEYSDIYKFYEDRKREHADRFDELEGED